MGDFNIYSLIGLVLRTLAVGIIVFYIIPKQFKEALRPKDWLTGLRWQMLALFSLAIVASVPAIVYQILVTNGIQAPILRNVATISGNLSFLGISIVAAMIYNFKKKE